VPESPRRSQRRSRRRQAAEKEPEKKPEKEPDKEPELGPELGPENEPEKETHRQNESENNIFNNMVMVVVDVLAKAILLAVITISRHHPPCLATHSLQEWHRAVSLKDRARHCDRGRNRQLRRATAVTIKKQTTICKAPLDTTNALALSLTKVENQWTVKTHTPSKHMFFAHME
jgi:hypothetical protein